MEKAIKIINDPGGASENGIDIPTASKEKRFKKVWEIQKDKTST